jgi:hypothetical protein
MDQFTTRRKLLRGSLSAPLVLTVASPAALANSSFIACIDRNEGLDTTRYKTAADNVFRVPVDVYKIEPVGSGWTTETRFELRGGRYYRIDQLDTTGITLPTTSTASGDGKRYKIVWFNKDGQEVGSGWLNPYNGEAVSISCMASFNGTAG